jgi:Butirosin biosynthesis protein H, N-terminal
MKLVSNFHHTPGIHCGSTALRDVLRHRGMDLSEAMCFGLGSGLGFYYFRNLAGGMPSHLFYGRTLTLEHDLCAHLALDFAEGVDDDADRAWQTAQEWIDRGVPLLLHVELSQLPYYNTRTPFPGHRVVLAGYDDARRVAFLADTVPGLARGFVRRTTRGARRAHSADSAAQRMARDQVDAAASANYGRGDRRAAR